MTRPMPRAARYALVQQYTGRRQALAAAAHAYLVFYENRPGFAIDWTVYTRQSLLRAIQHTIEPLETMPQCMCEEDFLIEVLWAFISNTPLAPAGQKEPVTIHP